MTTLQLNSAVRKLARMPKHDANGNTCEAFRAEFIRLYYADMQFEYMTKEPILIMYRLNQRHRIIPFHNFGIQVDQVKLGITE